MSDTRESHLGMQMGSVYREWTPCAENGVNREKSRVERERKRQKKTESWWCLSSWIQLWLQVLGSSYMLTNKSNSVLTFFFWLSWLELGSCHWSWESYHSQQSMPGCWEQIWRKNGTVWQGGECSKKRREPWLSFYHWDYLWVCLHGCCFAPSERSSNSKNKRLNAWILVSKSPNFFTCDFGQT